MSAPAITARTDFSALAARLAERARTLALARAAGSRLDAGAHWRRAALLWPRFTKG